MLSYASARLSEGDARKLLDFLIHKNLFRIIPVSLDVFNSAIKIYEKSLSKRLGFTDATTLAIAQLQYKPALHHLGEKVISPLTSLVTK